MSELSQRQKKELRAQGHALQPVVIVGKDNITDAVIKAVDQALDRHELVKVKLLQSVTVDKDDAADQLCARTGAALIQRIGRVALLYRPRPEEAEGA